MYSILYTYVNVENVGPRILGERESCVTHQVYKCKIYVFMGSSTFNKTGLKLSFLGNEREKGMLLLGKVVISCSASICYFLSFFFV